MCRGLSRRVRNDQINPIRFHDPGLKTNLLNRDHAGLRTKACYAPAACHDNDMSGVIVHGLGCAVIFDRGNSVIACCLGCIHLTCANNFVVPCLQGEIRFSI